MTSRCRRKSPPLPKLQMLSGKSGEWNSFIFQFRKTARYYGLDQRDKADGLVASLHGKAVDLIRKKPRKVQGDYRTLKDAPEQRLGKLEHPTVARCQLTYVRQEEGESLEDFADRILTMVPEAYQGIDKQDGARPGKGVLLTGMSEPSRSLCRCWKGPRNVTGCPRRGPKLCCGLEGIRIWECSDTAGQFFLDVRMMERMKWVMMRRKSFKKSWTNACSSATVRGAVGREVEHQQYDVAIAKAGDTWHVNSRRE